jgi:hypothetical protein
MRKAESIQVEIGKEMENIEAKYARRESGMIRRAVIWFRVVERVIKRFGS